MTGRASRSAGAGLVPTLDSKRYYRIGEVSRITGVKAYVLRYWESEFRWMAPQKSRSKQRLYRKRDIEMVLLIQQLLHTERYTIEGARRKLREMGIERALEEAPSRPPVMDHRTAYQRIRGELEAIRGML